MEYKTVVFAFVRAERTIVEYIHSPDGARIIRDNIRHWLSRRDFVLELLSNTTVEASPNVLARTLASAI